MQRVYEDDGFEFERLNLLGATYGGLSDVGEVLGTIERIPNADHEAWVREFAARADLLRAHADESQTAGHNISARSAYLRACTYYATASANAPGTSDPDRYHTLWEKHRECWDAAVPFFDPRVEKISIPFEDTALEGYFFHAANRGRAPHSTARSCTSAPTGKRSSRRSSTGCSPAPTSTAIGSS